MSFSTADHADTHGYAPLFWRLESPYRLVGGSTIGSLVKGCSARSTGRGRECCATTLEPMPGYEDGFCRVHQADEPRKRLCQDSSGFSSGERHMSGTATSGGCPCRLGASRSVRRCGGGRGRSGPPVQPIRGATTDMSSVAMFLRTIGRFEWASDLPGMRRGLRHRPTAASRPLLPVERCAVPVDPAAPGAFLFSKLAVVISFFRIGCADDRTAAWQRPASRAGR